MKGTLSLALGRSVDGPGVLRIEGSVDAATLHQLEAAFQRYEEKNIRTLIVDLTNMDYINSAGLGLLIKAKSEATKHKGDVVLVRPQPAVLNILKIMGLLDFFRVAPSVDDALRAPALD